MVKIYVGNLAKTARRDELQALFLKFGKVVECDILREFGFVHMEDVREAEEAVKALNGAMFCGNSMRVELSTAPKRDSRPPPSSRDRERDRSPRGRGDFHRDRDFYRERDYDNYNRGYAPQPPSAMSSSNGNSPSFYAMLAAAAATVHNQLRSSGTSHDSMEVYSRMYHAISNAAASFGNHSNGAPPPPPPLMGGYDRPSPSYSGGRYGGDLYAGGGGGGGAVGGYDAYDRRRF